MQDLSSLTRDQTHTSCMKGQSLNHWTNRDVSQRSTLSRGWQTFSVKDQLVNILGFSGHI